MRIALPKSDQEITRIGGDLHHLSKKIMGSGVNVNLCLHCRSCSGGCPFTEAMDLLPNHVLRLVQLNMEDEALQCSTIWVCVACNTCSIQCPMGIDIPAMMDALRHLALEKKQPIAEPDVLSFHQEVLKSIEKYGRTHKVEIMLRFKLKTRNYFKDLQAGMRLLARRKLDLRPSKVKNAAEIKNIFNDKRKAYTDGQN